MDKEKDKTIGIETENVAIPEIIVGDKEPEDDEKEAGTEIDYDCAIPEYHVKPAKKD